MATATATATGWYAILNQAGDENTAEIRIYEDIGFFGISAKRFVDELESVTAKQINLRLNTYGGEVFDAIAIYNALLAHPANVTVYVDGIAASSGSIIAMAGDEIRMADNAFLMIHNAWGGVMGEADDMRREADLLDKINDNIALTYVNRAGKTRKYWRDKMDAETWFTAAEAKEEGLADTIDKPVQPENRFDFKIYNNVPQAARDLWGKRQQQNNAPEPSPRGAVPPASTQEPKMADTPVTPPTDTPAQTPAAVVSPNLSQGNPLEALRAQEIQGYVEQGRIAGRKEANTDAIERCKAIMAACPGKPDMALNAFIAGHSPDTVKLAFEAAEKERVASEQRMAALQESHRREVALAAAGGYPGGVALAQIEPAEPDPEMTPEAAKELAEREWDRNPGARKGFSSKKNYVAVRVAELRGQFKGTAVSTSAA